MCCKSCGIAICEQDIRGAAQRLLRGGPHPIGVTCAPFKVDLKISANCPAGLLELALECRRAKLSLWIVFGVQDDDTDPPYPFHLLRARREWPCCCRATE